jgi:hypothetical protein
MKILLGAVMAATMFMGFSSTAQAGGGDPGFNLLAPATVDIGGTLDITLATSYKSLGILLFSDGPGPTVTPLGTFSLDFPVLSATAVQMFPIETVDITCPIPCDRSLIGTIGYAQFIAIRLDGTAQGISNGVAITVIDAPCT